MSWYQWDGEDLLLTLLVQPRASRDEFATVQGDAYKVRITVPPVDGRANEHLVRFLAKAFGVSRTNVHLVAGARSRRKVVRIGSPTQWPLLVQRL